MLCLKCATPNPETNRFCSTCGESLHAGGSGETETGSGVTRVFGPTSPTGGNLTGGTILGNRYRVIESIGMGGMGMVYRAVDLQLEVPVALKVIRNEFADNDKILERFKKEITIARKVTHKNVARIYDFGDADGIKYISMEYIEGRDLAHIIEKEGPLSADKAISILKQCCSALAEAHSQGVVHRDLKPHNVMLDGKGDVHLMDFGIALSQESRGLTRTGAIIGTPEYMAPEQAEGKKVDHRADIYSLGITIYEALTGVVPFVGNTQWEVIRKQIQDRARPLRKLRSEIPQWIETLVLKCLEKDPALRYQKVDDILKDIDRQRATRNIAAYAPQKRTVAYAAGVTLLVLTAVAVTMWLRPRGIVAGRGGRTSIAVLPFENQTGRTDLDWLKTGLAENLSTDLAQSKYFRVLTRERLGQILKDLGRAETDSIDAGVLKKIAEYGGVQAIISGSFVGSGDALRINLRAQDPSSGEGIGSAAVPGRESEVLTMIDQMTLRTKEILSVSKEKIAADTDTAIASARTSSVEAASLFQKGVDLVYQGKNLDAVPPLEEAARKDPDFALAYARLSQAYRNLGYDEKARDAGDKALSKVLKAVDRVTPADRTFIRAAHAAAANDPQEAIEAWAEMVNADPFDATAAYNLGRAHEGTGAWDKAEVFYRKALEIDPKYADAVTSVGRIKVLSGHPSDSLPEFEKALELYRQMGSKEGEAATYQAICNAHIDLRQWEEALTYCSKSASIKEAIGDKRGLASSLQGKSYVYQVSGRLDEALAAAQQVLSLFKEIGDTRGTAVGLTSLASIREDRGELTAALDSLVEAAALSRSITDEANEAESLDGSGKIRVQLGEAAAAEKDFAAAMEIYQRLGIEGGTAQVTSDQGLLALARGDLELAERQLSRADAQWKSLSMPEGVSETQYRQALVALQKGQNDAAIKLAGSALKDYEAAGDKLNVARCRLVRGSAAMKKGDQQSALRDIESALAAARALGSAVLVADLEGARAELHLASGASGAAAPLIESVCNEAARSGVARLKSLCGNLRSRAGRAAK